MNRYNIRKEIQPTRKISVSVTDILHTFKEGDTLSKLSGKFYENPKLSWVIMCANPEYFNEWEIKIGDKIRIPLPLTRIWNEWGIKSDI